MAKKLTKQELEQDPLLQSYSKVQVFYEEHKNLIIGSGIVVILIIAAIIGYYFYNESQNRKAEQLMGHAETYYMNGDYQKALTGSDEDFTVGFQQIINNYSGTKAGNLARYYAAVCEYKLGDTQKAITYMEDYDIPDGILGVSPLSFKAVLYADIGNNKEAAKTFVGAAELNVNDSTTPYNYLEAARAYADAGMNDQAKKYAQKVIDEYPDSNESAGAEHLIGKLTAGNIVKS